ncbi:MAG: hypothetical protein J7623_22365 [Chitinophaga sp.]|uniref:hypothetical protein n=1 Tax=Chitinophaga sp. TaxID=1869181 RepID=UPI001B22D420|nr:hypothetical protein [Chitinophaga sp.]MBO9731401.1 hypothetical protein [Chitinophaga sp.]
MLTLATVVVYLTLAGAGTFVFYGIRLLLGFAIGYWALFVTIAAEQFGTNMRATVATTVPNFVRGSVNIFTPLFLLLKVHTSIAMAAGIIALGTIIPALLALWRMEETFSKDLNYME